MDSKVRGCLGVMFPQESSRICGLHSRLEFVVRCRPNMGRYVRSYFYFYFLNEFYKFDHIFLFLLNELYDAVFMLFVAFKYYQQSMMKEECANEEGMQSIGVQIKGNVDLPTTLTQINKQNKVCVNRNDL